MQTKNILLALTPLLTLLSASPVPQFPTCPSGINFKATFGGDGLANLDLQSGSVHCAANVPYTGNPKSPTGAVAPTSGGSFVLACDDGGASTASFQDYGTTGSVVFTPAGQSALDFDATSTQDGNGVYQFPQQALCPN